MQLGSMAYLVVFYGIFFSGTWAIIPFILAIYSAFQSVSATIVADKINEFNLRQNIEI